MERWRIIKAFTLGPLLEASVPKPGNVSRCRDFDDLTFYHFLSGNIAIIDILHEATKIGRLIKNGTYRLNEAGIGELIKRAVQNSRAVQDSNPNFGVIALQIPLVMALSMSRHIYEARDVVKRLIDESTVRDTMEFYKAIRTASPKGVKSGVKYDVYSENVFEELFRDRINLKKLAELSCGRELIFCEWLTGYELSYRTFVRLKGVLQEEKLEAGVLRVFLELLSEIPDTLIARKAGKDEAELVKKKAGEVLKGRMSVEEFDAFLREKGDLRNPGSLADITAVALSLLILDGFRLEMKGITPRL